MRSHLTVLTDGVFDGFRFKEEPLIIEIEGDIISDIRPYRVEHVSGDDIIDARGALVMPGLINTHTHLARGGMFDPNEVISVNQIVRNLRDLLRAGVTTVGEMGCAAGLVHSLRSHLARHPSCGPSIVACGPLLTVKGGYPLDWLPPFFAAMGVALTCESEEEARLAVRKVKAMGMDQVKLVIMHRSYAEKPLRTISQEAAEAVVSEAHSLGFKVLVHAHWPEDYRLALEVGVDALMHSCFEPLNDELVEQVKESGVYVNPTLWVFEGALRGIENRYDHDPRYIRHVSRRVRKDWGEFCEAFERSGDVIPAGIAGGLPKDRGREAIENTFDNFAKLREAGIPMALGSDASYGFCLVGRPVDELSAMQRAGMSPEEVLKSATSNAAILLGCGDRGTLEAGKRADMIIVDRETMHDVNALERVEAVVKSGRLVKDSPLDQAVHTVQTAASIMGGMAKTALWSLGGRR
jgi:imidazolonepropionase-like amidohydrolase